MVPITIIFSTFDLLHHTWCHLRTTNFDRNSLIWSSCIFPLWLCYILIFEQIGNMSRAFSFLYFLGWCLVTFKYIFSGQGDFLGKKDEHSSPFSVANKMCMKLSNGGTYLSSTAKDLPALELCPGQTYLPHSKIKLQLFPINEVTCKGLEKVS